MKKVYFYILIGILMLFSFAGCSSKEEASEEDVYKRQDVGEGRVLPLIDVWEK